MNSMHTITTSPRTHNTMAFAGLANAFVFSLLFLSSIAAVHGDVVEKIAVPPVLPPVKLPVPIVKPPVKPVVPPAKPPVKPVVPPAKPPVKPVVPPAKPPVKPVVPPAKPPVKPVVPPAKPPVAVPPVLPPVKPPTYPPFRPSVVQGVVYCKSCKYRGIDTLFKASPLTGAVVKLVCSKTKTVETRKTDKNGYFFFIPKNLTPAASRTCKVFLVSSPLKTCNAPTNLRGGVTGSPLIPAAVKPPKKNQKLPFIYNVGPFAFEPSKKLPCKY